MTKNQKWLKGLKDGEPTMKTTRRCKKRPGYVVQFVAAHERKRQALLKKRQEAERAAKETAQAAKKGAR